MVQVRLDCLVKVPREVFAECLVSGSGQDVIDVVAGEFLFFLGVPNLLVDHLRHSCLQAGRWW